MNTINETTDRATAGIVGLHHITLIASNAQRSAHFYAGVLGLRLVKTTVNFDDPGSYHLYFGDRTGGPGTVVTFFEWPGAARGRTGLGGTHHVALRVSDFDALLRWKRRLTDLGVRVIGPYDRHYFTSIYLRDPDGFVVEIATDGPGLSWDEAGDIAQRMAPVQKTRGQRDEAAVEALTWPEPVPVIDEAMQLTRGMHHITAFGSDLDITHEFYGDVLGMTRVKMTENFDDPGRKHWYWGTPDARPGSLITYLERPVTERRAAFGAGTAHHFALAVATDDEQARLRERLLELGHYVSPVLDRVYFKSIYTRDPDGHIVEVATLGPGFLVDEPENTTGTTLRLPPWLAAQQQEIEARLTPLERSAWV